MAIPIRAYWLREVVTEEGTSYHISFRDGQGKIQKLCVSYDFYMAFRRLELDERKLEGWDYRHREFSELMEETLNWRALQRFGGKKFCCDCKRKYKGTSATALSAYLNIIRKWVPSEPVIHIDDSDVVKPDGYKFEALGLVRDGSKSTNTKNIYEKGYHVTEVCVLTDSYHPVSIFSEIHSSKEKNFTSINTVTFSAMERGASLFGRATFVMDRGYDDNKMFLKLDELNQDYVIRLTAKRKLLFHGKWVPATQLRNQRKGKIKTPLTYRGKQHDAYLSHVKVQITASRKDIYLVLVYGLTEHPMMLATNKEIKSKDDVIKVAKLCFSRWRIEEYFRCKKQMFCFENFRVRKLAAINALNFYITLCMAFLAQISMQPETNPLKVSIIQKAVPIKEKVHFCYYRLAKGILGILSYAKEGIRLWFRTKRPKYRQLCLKLVI